LELAFIVYYDVKSGAGLQNCLENPLKSSNYTIYFTNFIELSDFESMKTRTKLTAADDDDDDGVSTEL